MSTIKVGSLYKMVTPRYMAFVYDELPPYGQFQGHPRTLHSATAVAKASEGTVMVALEIISGYDGNHRIKALKVCIVPSGTIGWLQWYNDPLTNEVEELTEKKG